MVVHMLCPVLFRLCLIKIDVMQGEVCEICRLCLIYIVSDTLCTEKSAFDAQCVCCSVFEMQDEFDIVCGMHSVFVAVCLRCRMSLI